jgi:hypothetical protein
MIHFFWYGKIINDFLIFNMPNLCADLGYDVYFWCYQNFNTVLPYLNEKIKCKSLLEMPNSYLQLFNIICLYNLNAAKDLASLWILYEYGGFLLDTTCCGDKVKLHKPAENFKIVTRCKSYFYNDLNDYEGMLNFGTIGQNQFPLIDVWAICSKPRNGLVEYALESYCDRLRFCGLNKYPTDYYVNKFQCKLHDLLTLPQYRLIRNKVNSMFILSSLIDAMVKIKPVNPFWIIKNKKNLKYITELNLYKKHCGLWR